MTTKQPRSTAVMPRGVEHTPKGRKSPPVTVRRPPVLPGVEPVDPATVAGFVQGASASGHEGTETPAHEGTKAPKPRGTSALKRRRTDVPVPVSPTGRAMVKRAGGKAARRVVVYMDPGDAKRLALRGVEEGRDVSSLVNEAVRRFLAE